ncbi:MAG: sulfotransferase [Candidatus Brocadiaceae bacterium]|nr:sulfotransferase [Candidatus Brocadiaceae bacterium]
MTEKHQLDLSPIFIVGPPRSGTTLTAKILGRHSRLFMPGETHFFDDIYYYKKKLGDPQEHESMEMVTNKLMTIYERYNEPLDQIRLNKLSSDNSFVQEMKSTCNDYCEIYTYFMERQMRHEGKSRWGNNTPRDIFNVDAILSFYPKAKFIICVRDVRDYLLSYQNKWRITSNDNVQRLKKLYHPVVTTLLWKSSVRLLPNIRAKIPEENLLVICYEELVRKPEETVHKICRMLEEEFEPNMLDVDNNNSSLHIRGKGIFASSVGRWQGKLSNEEVYVAQLLTLKENRLLGYKLVIVRVNFFKVVNILLLTPFALFRAFKVNSKTRASLIPYLFRRSRSLFAKT